MSTPTETPDVLMRLHWQDRIACLSLHGQGNADLRLDEVGAVLLNHQIRVVIIDLTDLHPYAPPDCLRALLRLRAALRRNGVRVVIQRGPAGPELMPGCYQRPAAVTASSPQRWRGGTVSRIWGDAPPCPRRIRAGSANTAGHEAFP